MSENMKRNPVLAVHVYTRLSLAMEQDMFAKRRALRDNPNDFEARIALRIAMKAHEDLMADLAEAKKLAANL
jgi:GrpB-like predicted nucleotidyltransferase (UPF0157 family)